MKIRKIITYIINKITYLIIKIFENLNLYNLIRRNLISYNSNKTKKIFITKKKKLYFFVPNDLTDYRVNTFFSKEPDTLNWIDNFEKKSIFWDVGSNIGLYSCYAAMKKNCKVFSFEPSYFNLPVLSKNINYNNLQEKISIVPLPLSDKSSYSNFNMSDITVGGALSSFSSLTGYDGKNIKKNFCYKTLGLTIDDVKTKYKLHYPDYLKIDVDGIDHLVLKGGVDTIKNCKSILIEINLKFKLQFSLIKKILKKSNFVLRNETRLVNEKSSRFYQSFNQIWIKKKKLYE